MKLVRAAKSEGGRGTTQVRALDAGGLVHSGSTVVGVHAVVDAGTVGTRRAGVVLTVGRVGLVGSFRVAAVFVGVLALGAVGAGRSEVVGFAEGRGLLVRTVTTLVLASSGR